ncbi:MAG: HD domain-containing phosphohydrolase [Bacillota bacterium]
MLDKIIQLQNTIEEQELLLDNIDLLVWYLLSPDRVGLVNQKFADFFGRQKDFFQNRKLNEFIQGKTELENSFSNNKEAFIRKNKLKIEESYTNKDGEERIFEVTKTPKLNNHDGVDYVFCTARDITEQKKIKDDLKKTEYRYWTIFNLSPVGIMVIDRMGNIIDVNQKFSEMKGYSREELIGNNLFEIIIEPENEMLAQENIKRVIAGETISQDVIGYNREGKKVYINLLETAIDIGNNQRGLISLQTDITEKKETEAILKNQHRTIKELHKTAILLNESKSLEDMLKITISSAENILDFKLCYISLVEGDNLVVRASSDASGNKFQKIPLGEGLAGKTYASAESYIVNDLSSCNEAILTDKNLKSAISIPIKNFGVFQAVSADRNAYHKNDLELAELLVSHLIIVMEELKHRKELEYKSYHDDLTNTYNRRYFKESLSEIEAKRLFPVSIIIADLNGLKIINDSYGSDTGDQVLIRTARKIKAVIRPGDLLARIGGDEFGIVLTETDQKEARLIYDKIKENSQDILEDQVPISLGMGTATWTAGSNQSLEKTVKEAENKMYQHKLLEDRSAKNRVVAGLLNTLSAKSDETEEHASRMAAMAYQLGDKLGLSELDINRLSLLASLHDIGKISVPEEVLNKPDRLTDSEWEKIKEHPERGYRIASATEEFSAVAREILAHHEHWDGSGYPNGLKGEEIPYLARMISIVDAFDVMTNDRSYKKAITKEVALKEIEKCAGSQFDPELAKEFIVIQQQNVE